MKIAVTTPTGHVGSAVIDILLLNHSNVEVTLLGRRPDRLASTVQRGAKLAVGSLDDADYLTQATRGVDALFWVTPPGYGSDNVRAFQNRLGKAAAYAVRVNQLPHVVNMSAIGANWDSGVGPINGLHDIESHFNEVTANIVHLRPGFFFENLLWQIDSLRQAGRFSLPISGWRRYPMIASRDIARAAVEWLTNPDWAGRHICELHGPEDLSCDNVAETLSQTLRRKIDYVQCRREEMRHVLLESALSENAADLLLEMYEAVESGRLKPQQPRSPETTTTTTLSDFARDVILPLFSESVVR